MPLEDLIEEIRRRGEAELTQIAADKDRVTSEIAAERDHAVAEIQKASAEASRAEIARERAQRTAAAKLLGRKRLYEAREARLEQSIADTRELLAEYTGSDEYPDVLKRMYSEATSTLGKQIRVSGRSEDAALLQKVAGKSFDPKPQPILGGLVAETPDGSRRLNLTFDELLRLHEDQVRELLA
jgi:V/A-type H+/Na+-transporting ATPase subunit E